MSETQAERDLREKTHRRMVGCAAIVKRLKASGDPDALADGAFLLGALNDVADYVALLRGLDDEWMEPYDGSGIAWHESLPSPYTYERGDFCKLVAAVHEYEARAKSAEARVADAEKQRDALEASLRDARGALCGLIDAFEAQYASSVHYTPRMKTALIVAERAAHALARLGEAERADKASWGAVAVSEAAEEPDVSRGVNPDQ